METKLIEEARSYATTVYENTIQFFTAYELYVQILTCKCMDKNNECHIETLRDKFNIKDAIEMHNKV